MSPNRINHIEHGTIIPYLICFLLLDENRKWRFLMFYVAVIIQYLPVQTNIFTAQYFTTAVLYHDITVQTICQL